MTLLSTADLTAMRAVQALTFDLTGVITRPPVSTSDGAGGWVAASETTVATVACRLGVSQTQEKEAIIAGVVQGQTVWRITMPKGTDAKLKDRIAIGTRSFEVMALWGPHTFDTALVALCVER